MTVLFDHFTLRIWRSLLMVYLDNWSMLNLIQTNKLMNKNKTYVYMIIFQTIKTLGFNYNGFSFKPPMYNLLEDNGVKVNHYLIYNHHYLNTNIFIYNIDNLKLLLKNNSNLRNMLENYVKNFNLVTNKYTDLKLILDIL